MALAIGGVVLSAVISVGVSLWVTSVQLDSAEDMARDERLGQHIVALEGFRQSVRIFGDILDDHSGRGAGPEGTGQASEDITEALAEVQQYALQVRTTANAGDLDGTETLQECDDLLREAADGFLAIPVSRPLSWDDVHIQFVDEEKAPGEFSHIDAQVDQILPATREVLDGVEEYIRDGSIEADVECEGIHPRAVD